MGFFYRSLLRPLLFMQDCERAHDFALASLAFAARHASVLALVRALHGVDSNPVEAMGLRFSNRVGVAAGLDKRAIALPAWAALGFGFCEVGGVTWHAQDGNPKPRMFRAIADRAIVNRMGFNNGGAPALARTLRAWRECGMWPDHPVGVNLGKSKITPLEEAASDYSQSFAALADHADFFVVNVSSPNTPNLRQLQDRAALDSILEAIQAINGRREKPRPILVKVAPDLSFDALDEILELVEPRRLAGIVATNTTIARPETKDAQCRTVYSETGGLSGAPLEKRATEVIAHLAKRTNGKLPIIGVGGIRDVDTAKAKLDAGATLLQLYSALVYEGPGLVKRIVTGLARDRQ